MFAFPSASSLPLERTSSAEAVSRLRRPRGRALAVLPPNLLPFSIAQGERHAARLNFSRSGTNARKPIPLRDRLPGLTRSLRHDWDWAHLAQRGLLIADRTRPSAPTSVPAPTCRSWVECTTSIPTLPRWQTVRIRPGPLPRWLSNASVAARVQQSTWRTSPIRSKSGQLEEVCAIGPSATWPE